MSILVLSVLALLFLSSAGTLAEGDSTCRACHCQFNNVEVLDQLIEDRIRNILVNDTESTQAIEERIINTLASNATSTQAIEERIINTLNTDSASTQTLETRITNTVEDHLGT